eukprot:10973134-Alexandrium_andersonii.AAC.1
MRPKSESTGYHGNCKGGPELRLLTGAPARPIPGGESPGSTHSPEFLTDQPRRYTFKARERCNL